MRESSHPRRRTLSMMTRSRFVSESRVSWSVNQQCCELNKFCCLYRQRRERGEKVYSICVRALHVLASPLLPRILLRRWQQNKALNRNGSIKTHLNNKTNIDTHRYHTQKRRRWLFSAEIKFFRRKTGRRVPGTEHIKALISQFPRNKLIFNSKCPFDGFGARLLAEDVIKV